MMEQYLSIKASCQDALLLFRLGDFYELFFEDAKVASQLLDLTLTGRGKDDARMPMCGVPYHAADGYISRLVEAGYKVAICEQMEDPKAVKGLVRRDVIRMITPGTGFDFVRDDHGLLVATVTACTRLIGKWTGAVMDPMTGESMIQDGTLQDISQWFATLRVKELVYTGETPEVLYDWMEKYVAQESTTLSRLPSTPQFKETDEPGHIVLVSYLEYTGKRPMLHIKDPELLDTSSHLSLSSSAVKHLELLSPLTLGRKGATLLEVLDFTRSAMGKRKLRQMIERPNATLAPILQRQDAVAQLVDDGLLRDELQSALKGIHDLARISSRVSFGSAVPRDLALLAQGLCVVADIQARLKIVSLQGELAQVAQNLDALPELAAEIMRTLVDDPSGAGKDGGIVKAGADADVDRLREMAHGSRSHLSELERAQRARTGIRSLKVAYNRVFGYYIEVTAANLHLVPSDYERKQTLAGAERFVTAELRQYEQEILQADELLKSLEWDHFVRLLSLTQQQLLKIEQTADAVGTLDALLSLATAARMYDYHRPIVDESFALDIKDGRHPVVERYVTGNFVPNDAVLDGEGTRIGLITGPNMAGKSTYMRQVALIVLLAQMGSFVPASSCRIGLVDKLFTRIGASDDVAAGMSTFMVEMSEAAEILQGATHRSLIVLDEIGRGTSTYDGLSIAQAMIEHLHDVIKARTLFATHYHEMTVLPERFKGIVNLSVAVSLHNDQLVFLHQIVHRPADRSYGIHVAQRAGLPESVTKRAKDILRALELASKADDPAFACGDGGYDDHAMQVAATLEESPPLYEVLFEELHALDVDGMTPRAAQEYLYGLVSRVKMMLHE